MQLLVKINLFVVIIAIDGMHLCKALEAHYEVLQADYHPSGLVDYMEKIIVLVYTAFHQSNMNQIYDEIVYYEQIWG